jgi:hypothetical protein
MALGCSGDPHHLIKNPMPSDKEISSGDLASEDKSMHAHSDCMCGQGAGLIWGDLQPPSLISHTPGPRTFGRHPCLQRAQVGTIHGATYRKA